MYSTLATLIDHLDGRNTDQESVITWGAPVPAFGDPSKSRVATLGINPSNREFVDESGTELVGDARRFHTLSSLSLSSWGDVDSRHLLLIVSSCREYFRRNPYDQWFKRLDQVVVGTGASFYDEMSSACHLDLIPYATSQKWTDLSPSQRAGLLKANTAALGSLLRDSSVEVLILNGRAVVDHLQRAAAVTLRTEERPMWRLRRKGSQGVAGISYEGWISRIGNVDLGRKIFVAGFNHNLQSSYGVTAEVVREIRHWISEITYRAPNETAR